MSGLTLDPDERSWLAHSLLALLIVPLLFGAGFYIYRSYVISDWVTAPASHVLEIKQVVETHPGLFSNRTRMQVNNFDVTEATAGKVAQIARYELFTQLVVALMVLALVNISVQIYYWTGNSGNNKEAKKPKEKSASQPIAKTKYQTDMDLALWLMNLGGAGGSAATVVSTILLNKTTNLFMVMGVVAFIEMIAFGLLARSLMSGAIEKEDSNSVTVAWDIYLDFWDKLRLQFFILFLAIANVALGIFLS